MGSEEIAIYFPLVLVAIAMFIFVGLFFIYTWLNLY